MKQEDKTIEIPFGVFDSELGGFEYTIPEGYEAEIKDGKVIVRKAESEDERIRTLLIDFIRNYNWLRVQSGFKGATKEDVIAWLEKQGKQKPTDKVEPKFKVGDKIISTISNIPYYITEVCNGHYLTDVGCIIMFNAQGNFELVEQNPAWSEEDDRNLLIAIQYVFQHGYLSTVDWLKSLKDRVGCEANCTTTKEWSEEDEEMLDSIVNSIEITSGRIALPSLKENYTKQVDWLKSLRPLKQWKPTEEQLEALQKVISGFASVDFQVLKRLLTELKAL